MDLVKLTETETWYPDSEILDGFTSKIWTERYVDDCDFELVTPRVEWAVETIPEGSWITHLETKEVMEVTDIEIGFNEDGKEEARITGEGIESVLLKKRGIMGTRGDTWALPQSYTNPRAAAVIIWDMVASGFGDPIVSKIGGTREDYGVSNLIVSDTTGLDYGPTATEQYVQPGESYKQVREFLSIDMVGLRSMRPDTFGRLLTFSDGAGVETWWDWANHDRLRFDIYDGVDLSNTVIFNHDVGDLQRPKYLRSNKNYANEAYVLASTTAADDVFVRRDGVADGIGVGTFRRQIIVDGEIDQTFEIDGVEYVLDLEVYKGLLRKKGGAELSARRKRILYRGAISPSSHYKYNVDYKLGDIVKVQGRYGLNDQFRVMEHIRTENAEGDKGYPTLILAD